MQLENFHINLALLGWIASQNYIVNNTFINSELFTIENISVFCGEKNGVFYCCFQGTSSFKDAIDDIKIEKINIVNGIKIHKGWYKEYKSIENFIMEKIKGYNQIIFTGQSKGVAISCIAAYFVKQKYINSKEVSVIGFASPCIGNANFIKAFKDLSISILLYQYLRDPIIYLPPYIFGYRKITKSIRFGKYKWYDILLFPILLLGLGFYQHQPINYMKFKI